MKKFIPFISLITLFSCSAPERKSFSTDSLAMDSVVTDTTTKKEIDTTAKNIQSDAPKTNWTYSEEQDKMTSKAKYFASVDANDLLEFGFPYDGGSTATLTIRKQSRGNEVLLTVSKGQFNVGVDGAEVIVRVDNSPAATYNASGPSDGSTEVLFINGANKLIKKLRTAKKVLIQAEFFDNGNKVMEFDVDGFKWNH